MTLVERAASYNAAFAQYPASHLEANERWIQGIWILGQDYRGSGYYGSYPPAYLRRIHAVFPDKQRVLHAFAGSLPQSATRALVTVDRRVTEEVKPGVQADILKLPFADKSFDICYSDPPYSDLDAVRYDTPMPNRRAALYEIHRVVQPGGHLVWLDTVLPMFSKTHWHWCGVIGMWRSTNHRIRGVMIFERTAYDSQPTRV